MKILVIPDVHGRTFWREAVKRDDVERVVFLGDYHDPYRFDGIKTSDSVTNFSDILSYADRSGDRVVMLLGNHDLPYFSKHYLSLSRYHSRYDRENHERMEEMFESHKDRFRIAYCEGGVLFTHAGVIPEWFRKATGTEFSEGTDLYEAAGLLNTLLDTDRGIESLFSVGAWRGGDYAVSSCVWADIHETVMEYDDKDNPAYGVKQVFGHTIQGYYGEDGQVRYGKPFELANLKMLDTACAYILDTDHFTIEKT